MGFGTRHGYSPPASTTSQGNTSTSTDSSVYVPKNFGLRGWKAARSAAGSNLARVAVVGDSIAAGQWSSNLDTKSWPGLIRASLQSAYGDGGSGFKSTYDTVLGLNNSGYTTALPASCLIQTTGTWAVGITIPEGPAGNVLQSSTSGASLTYTVRGTKVSVVYLTTLSTVGGSFTITVDGSLLATIDTQAANAKNVVEWISGTLAAGNHTVVIAASSATAVNIGGLSGRNASGVVVDKYARGGYPSTSAANGIGTVTWVSGGITYGSSGTGSFGPAGMWSGGSKRPCDLVIYAHGLNDTHLTTPTVPDQYIRNVRRYLDDVMDGPGQVGATDVVLLVNHQGTGIGSSGQSAWDDSASQYYANYNARLRGLAAAYGAALIDINLLGRNSWNYWNSLGRWGSSASPGVAGTDQVHLSDAGQQAVADAVLPVLTA